MSPAGMAPVAGAGTAHSPGAEAAPPVPRTHQAPGSTPPGLLGLPKELRTEVFHLLAPRDVASLPPDARHAAFLDLVNHLERLPADGTSRMLAALTLARSIHALPPDSHGEAARQVAGVLRPLPAAQVGRLLSEPDLVLPAAVRDALRQALNRAGTSARA